MRTLVLVTCTRLRTKEGFLNTLNFEDRSPNQQTILDREGTEDTGESEEDGNSDLGLSA
jgi:hypothetical protein